MPKLPEEAVEAQAKNVWERIRNAQLGPWSEASDVMQDLARQSAREDLAVAAPAIRKQRDEELRKHLETGSLAAMDDRAKEPQQRNESALSRNRRASAYQIAASLVLADLDSFGEA